MQSIWQYVRNHCVLAISFLFAGLTGTYLAASDTSKNEHTFLYSHGFLSSEKKSKRYIDAQVLPPTTRTFNYPDAQWSFEPLNGLGIGLKPWKSAIGQAADVKALASQINACGSEKKIVLFGESRGSSTILNYLGSPDAQPDKIKAVVLDSPFDNMRQVVAHRIKRFYLDKLISAERIIRLLPILFWSYEYHGLQPIDSVKKINKDIPILFICSREDKSISYLSSVALYEELVRSGHRNVHILILDCGPHAYLMAAEQKSMYRNAIHAFYERYGIEHIHKYALLGKPLLFA